MRIKRMAGLGLAAGALVLSGAIAAVADNTTGETGGEATTLSGTATLTPTTGAVPGEDGPGRGERVRHMVVNGEPLTDSQRECMEDNGAVPPGRPGERPTREDMEAHRATMEAAMDECGVEHPSGPAHPGRPGDGPHRVLVVGGEELTDEQRACMEENAPPPPFEKGERPTREDFEEHRASMEAAMDECGIEHPEPREGAEGGFVVHAERGGDVQEFGWVESGSAAAVPADA